MKKAKKCDDCRAAEKLLVRIYRASRKLHWQEGETEAEAIEEVDNFMQQLYGPLWSRRFRRDQPKPPAASVRAGDVAND